MFSIINESLFSDNKRTLLSFTNLSNKILVWLSWEPEPPIELHLFPVYPSNKVCSVLYLIEPVVALEERSAEVPEGTVKWPEPPAFKLP